MIKIDRSSSVLSDVHVFEIQLEMKRAPKPNVYFLKLADGAKIAVLPTRMPVHLRFVIDDFDEVAKSLEST